MFISFDLANHSVEFLQAPFIILADNANLHTTLFDLLDYRRNIIFFFGMIWSFEILCNFAVRFRIYIKS